MVSINWPSHPTEITPANPAAVVGQACKILANSSTELARRKIVKSQHLHRFVTARANRELKPYGITPPTPLG
jgi:hypothetical protein